MIMNYTNEIMVLKSFFNNFLSLSILFSFFFSDEYSSRNSDVLDDILSKRQYDDREDISIDKRSQDEGAGDNGEMSQSPNNDELKHKKRLETVDGVEIASSYKEYVELAIDDVNDRLNKNFIQMNYTEKLIVTREKLRVEIDRETSRRYSNADELREKHKTLRDRLTHNTKMKDALVELANIAGFSLKDNKKSDNNRLTESNDEEAQLIDEGENKTLLTGDSLAKKIFLSQGNNFKIGDNNSYNQYIEMAYAEVNTVLSSDKQMLIEVIRQKKDNDKRLRKLETLKVKVESSLKKFKIRADKLADLIKKQIEIKTVLTQLKSFMEIHKMNATPLIDQQIQIAKSEPTIVKNEQDYSENIKQGINDNEKNK